MKLRKIWYFIRLDYGIFRFVKDLIFAAFMLYALYMLNYFMQP